MSVLDGALTLVAGTGRKTLNAGECAGFPKGQADGHHFINESGADAVYLEVGTRAPYPKR